MKTLLALSIVLALAGGNAGAQTHTHAASTPDGHDHAAASGSGQAIFDAAVIRAPDATTGGTRPSAAPAGDPHAAHAGHSGAAVDGDDPHAGHGHQHEGRATQQAQPSSTPSAEASDPHAAHRSAAQDEPHAGHAMAADATAQPREPIPVPTHADRAVAFPELHEGHAHGTGPNSLVRFNRFEAWDADPGTGQAWEGSAWFGGDIQRLWLRSEGEREHGSTAAADLEVLYGRGISAWWDLVAGMRHDFAPGPSQSWAAFGVQGMAPYKFEVSATAYLGEHGHSAFVAEAEYELLLTNRLVLQPLLEVELRGQDDPLRGIGSGLSTAEAGLRLRYEITRRFAPYVGLVHERAFGGTADHRRIDGEATRETRWVAGVRWWF